jgi:hypothetical protein
VSPIVSRTLSYHMEERGDNEQGDERGPDRASAAPRCQPAGTL